MSSFEPLFAQPTRSRRSPRVVSTAKAWMPKQVGSSAPRRTSIFETPVEESFGSAEERAQNAADAAAALTRQAELDAAYLRGVSEGREQAEQAERARLRGAMMAAESALDDVRLGEARWLANIEENIAAISVAVAKQIVVLEVASTQEIVLGLVTRAVQEFGLDQALSIRVNPGDLESLMSVERGEADDVTVITKGREVRWLSDARIEAGGCVVEGRERIVDARVDTGLERVYRRLTYTNA